MRGGSGSISQGCTASATGIAAFVALFNRSNAHGGATTSAVPTRGRAACSDRTGDRRAAGTRGGRRTALAAGAASSGNPGRRRSSSAPCSSRTVNSALGEHVERPQRSAVDRPHRRPIAAHVRHAGGRSAARLASRSRAKPSGVNSYTRWCRWPCDAISCPAWTISPTSAGCRSAIQPRTKNVPRTPHASSRLEHIPRRLDDAARQRVPAIASQRPIGVADVKPLLDVHGEAIAHVAASPATPGSSR